MNKNATWMVLVKTPFKYKYNKTCVTYELWGAIADQNEWGNCIATENNITSAE